MFIFNKDASLVRGAAGEAIVLRFKLAQTAGEYEDMIATGTSLVLVLYDGAQELFYGDADLDRDLTGVYAEWIADGNVTEKLRGKANVSGEIAKRGSRNSRTTLTTFMVQIVSGAPRIESYNNGQVADHATLIVRTFDPTVPDTKPEYNVSVVPYVEDTITVPAITLGNLALSLITATAGMSFTSNITGAKAGSTLTASGLPAGLVLNSAARTITGTPTTAGSTAFTLVETLSGATGSPKSNTIALTISAAPVASSTTNTISNSNLLPGQVSGAHDLFTAREARIKALETAFAS